MREIVERLTLQDWLVPVVYEARPMRVFTPRPADQAPAFRITTAGATPGRGTLDQALPAVPDAGFFGRDETLLALDRAFDSQPIVLLHAFAGSGWSSTSTTPRPAHRRGNTSRTSGRAVASTRNGRSASSRSA